MTIAAVPGGPATLPSGFAQVLAAIGTPQPTGAASPPSPAPDAFGLLSAAGAVPTAASTFIAAGVPLLLRSMAAGPRPDASSAAESPVEPAAAGQPPMTAGARSVGTGVTPTATDVPPDATGDRATESGRANKTDRCDVTPEALAANGVVAALYPAAVEPPPPGEASEASATEPGAAAGSGSEPADPPVLGGPIAPAVFNSVATSSKSAVESGDLVGARSSPVAHANRSSLLVGSATMRVPSAEATPAKPLAPDRLDAPAMPAGRAPVAASAADMPALSLDGKSANGQTAPVASDGVPPLGALPAAAAGAGVRPAKCAAPLAGRSEPPARAASRHEAEAKTPMPPPPRALAGPAPSLGTGTAPAPASMSCATTPARLLPADTAVGVGAPAGALPGPADAASPATPAAPTASAHAAVEAVFAATERVAARTQNAVVLQFTIGETELKVHVALRSGQVETTFRTDSSELRHALAAEWQNVTSAPAAARPVRLAAPVFTSADQSPTSAGEHGTSHQRSPGHHAPEPALSWPGRTRPRLAVGPDAPARPFAAAAQHLQTVA